MDFESQLQREVTRLDKREGPKLNPADVLDLLKREAAFNALAREVLKEN